MIRPIGYFGLIGRISAANGSSIRLLRSVQIVRRLNRPCRLVRTASTTSSQAEIINRRLFFVALPELPKDTPEDNEALRIPGPGDKPTDFSKLDFEKCYLAVNKTITEFESIIEDLDHKDQNDEIWKDPRKLFHHIEDGLYKVDSTCYLMNLMHGLKRKEFPILTKELCERYSAVRQRIYGSEELRAAIENFAEESQNYEKSVQNILKLYLHESRPYGRKLTAEQASTIERIEDHIQNHITSYWAKYQSATASFTHTIDDPDILEAIMPEWSENDSAHHRSRTPIQINFKNVSMFIRLCPDSDLRRSLFRSLNRLCSPGGNPLYNTKREFENLRGARKEIATSLLVRNHFEMLRNRTHVQSQDLILRTIDKLNRTNMKIYREKLSQLSEYASCVETGNPYYDGVIEEGDLAYWKHKYKHDVILGCKPKQMDSYFPSDKVFIGVSNFLRDYFDIYIKKIVLGDSSVWSQDVKMYQVSYKGQDLGTFYHEAFGKEEKRQGTVLGRIRGKSNLNELKALLFLCNPITKDARGKTSMSQNDIRNFFYGIGLIMQEFLYREKFYELNIRGAFKPDNNTILPNLFLTWLYRDPRILQSCSHTKDGKQLDLDEVKKIIKSETYFNCVRNSNILYKSHLDLEINTSLDDVSKKAAELYTIYKPFTYDVTTYQHLTDLDLVIRKSSLYYGEMWSKLIATDCFDLYQVPEEVSSSDLDIIKEMSDRIIESMFDSKDDADLLDRLAGITGNGFKLSQPSFGVL